MQNVTSETMLVVLSSHVATDLATTESFLADCPTPYIECANLFNYDALKYVCVELAAHSHICGSLRPLILHTICLYLFAYCSSTAQFINNLRAVTTISF
jgi:hypothetical protein